MFIRIDIEKFQLINSFFGMDEGDNLLKYMADYLQNVEKEYRYITYGRIEADIFAVCFSYENEKEITDFVKNSRIRWKNILWILISRLSLGYIL